MIRVVASAVIAWSLLLVAIHARAQSPEGCLTPRMAADSVFYWQEPARHDLVKAARCLDPAGRTLSDRQRLARTIKRVYDARGYDVARVTLSDQNQWVNAAGQSIVAPHPALDTVVIARGEDGQWRWTAASLDQVEELGRELSYLELLAQRLPPWLQQEVAGVAYWQYLALLLVLFCGAVARKVVQFVAAERFASLAGRHGHRWAQGLAVVLASPGALLVMAGLLRVTYPFLALPLSASSALAFGVRLLAILAVVWALYRLVDVLSAMMAEKAAKTDTKLDDQLVPLIRKSLKIFTVVAGSLFLLQNCNINVGSLLAGLGIGGVAIALAAKDTVANFFGSIMIFVDRPFQIGDWVKVEGAAGMVEEVGFRSTRIRTLQNSLLTVPNARFTEAQIDNLGQFRRTSVTIGLTYETTPEQMQSFVEGVRAIIQANPYTRKDCYEIHMSGFGAFALEVMLYFFLDVDSWSLELRERHNLFLEIMRLARALGVDFAFPTQTLHVDYVPGSPHVRSEQALARLAEVVESFGPGGALARPAGPRVTHGYLSNSVSSAVQTQR